MRRPAEALPTHPTLRRAPIALGALVLTTGAIVVALRGSAGAARSTSIVPEPVPTPAPPPPEMLVDSAEPLPPDVPFGPPRPLRKVLLTQSRVTPAITRTALELLDRPMGSEVVRTLGDRDYAFVVEHHYHSPASGLTPVGWHKGVTVYALEE